MDWVDHAYIYGMVYLEQQFHQPTMSFDVFKDIDNDYLEHLNVYETPAAIPQWDGWCKMSKEDHYCLLFKHAEESTNKIVSEATSLYYYIGMDLNVGQLWKRTPAHVDVTTAGGPMTPPKIELEPLPTTTNVAPREEAQTTNMGRPSQDSKMG
ncbi:hypothetical protein C0992_005267 [Termitomyces sp. T32_za158]|nr:hypothetical protein C0992_005267 [Termitomyces sp. T32_za158]